MTLVVEDGTGVALANAYVTLDEVSEYAAARGLTFPTSPSTDGEAAIVRATAAIDAMYRGRFSGYRTHGRLQALAWPRSTSYDAEALVLDGDEIPIEIKQATCEAAVRELASPGAMTPDLERGGSIRRLKAGSVEIEYGGNASAHTVFTTIDGILAALLSSSSTSTFSGVAVRG
jgi:hypothetical protein